MIIIIIIIIVIIIIIIIIIINQWPKLIAVIYAVIEVTYSNVFLADF